MIIISVESVRYLVPYRHKIKVSKSFFVWYRTGTEHNFLTEKIYENGLKGSIK